MGRGVDAQPHLTQMGKDGAIYEKDAYEAFAGIKNKWTAK